MPKHNTDGSVNKLVTIFAFCSCFLESFIVFGAPGYAHLPAPKLVYRDLFIVPAGSLYRETAPVALTQILHRELILTRPQVCTAITPACNQNCTVMAKNRAVLRSLRPWRICHTKRVIRETAFGRLSNVY